MPPFISNTQLVTAPPGHWLRVRFHVDQPSDGTLWAATGWHASTTALTPPLYYGYSAERAAAIGFVEREDGSQVMRPFAFAMYPYGAAIEVGDVALRVDAQDNALCGASASGANPSLAPGTYVLTVLAASDLANGAGAFLPASGYVVDSVETGPSTPISESTLTCTGDAHAAVLGMSARALVGCQQAFTSTGRSFHGVFSGRFTDATHEVRYDPAHASSRLVGFFDGGVEPAGTAKLLVPKYVTPVGNPFYLGLPIGQPAALGSDSGIFGVHADIT